MLTPALVDGWWLLVAEGDRVLMDSQPDTLAGSLPVRAFQPMRLR